MAEEKILAIVRFLNKDKSGVYSRVYNKDYYYYLTDEVAKKVSEEHCYYKPWKNNRTFTIQTAEGNNYSNKPVVIVACKRLSDRKLGYKTIVSVHPVGSIEDESLSAFPPDFSNDWVGWSNCFTSKELADKIIKDMTTTAELPGCALTLDKLASINTGKMAKASDKSDTSQLSIGASTNSSWDEVLSNIQASNNSIWEITTVNEKPVKCVFSDANNYSKNNEVKKENDKMFENIAKDFRFGKAPTTRVKMSIYGPAFFGADGNWKAYDKKTDGWVDTTDMVFDMPIFMMPVAKKNVCVGDFIEHAGNAGIMYVRVIEVNKKYLKAENPAGNEVIEILPSRNVFGFDFYAKLIVPFEMDGFGGADEDNPFGMLPLMMMMDKKDTNSLLPFLMMGKGGGMDDIMSNPMMLYLLMGNNGAENDGLLSALVLGQMMATKTSTCEGHCNCSENTSKEKSKK